MKKQFRKSFVIIVTMEDQNVQVSVNFSHMIKGPGKLPGLCNRPILFVSSRGTPCRLIYRDVTANFVNKFIVQGVPRELTTSIGI